MLRQDPVERAVETYRERARTGLRLEPFAGWTFPEGRGGSFQDGVLVRRGSDRSVTFTVERCFGLPPGQ